MSDVIAVKGGNAYELKAKLRYTLPSGMAQISIIQMDSKGNNVGELQYTYSKGAWQWVDTNNRFVVQPETVAIRIRFGVGWAEEGAYLDVDQVELMSLNEYGTFEEDSNQNHLADFWELNWRNGVSENPFSKLAPYEPVAGKYHLRLYSGEKDAPSYQYSVSESIPVISGAAYKLNAHLRYAATNGKVQMSVIQRNGKKEIVDEVHYVYQNDQWRWREKLEHFVIHPKATTVDIRFGVGGQERAYLDVDNVTLSFLNATGKVKVKTYTYNENGQLKTIRYPNGKVVTYKYDANGNLLGKE
ncbi:RHS repeat domain-containing protein [Paenibacillus assamensis]|uniref:RHS repeat domain-containing protein n=1 Tax=Paenibacillus assamensis TaxID=311244 RepID=UPI0004903109|nr:RHS repeat domain-containing protein [Paenibacillus assamensis]